MLLPLTKDVLSKTPFIHDEVSFNLLHRITDSETQVALRSDDGRMIAACNPNHMMWLWIDKRLDPSHITEHIHWLCEALSQQTIKGVAGAPHIARAFAKQYAASHNATFHLSMGMVPYACTEVIYPSVDVGHVMRAKPYHQDIIADYCVGFMRDCFNQEVTVESQMASVKRLIDSGDLYVLSVDGEVVSMANIAHRSPRHARINNVYTPPAQRKKGYASQLIAKISSLALEEGLIPMLYADVLNPTSNKVYQNVGYRATGQIDAYTFK